MLCEDNDEGAVVAEREKISQDDKHGENVIRLLTSRYSSTERTFGMLAKVKLTYKMSIVVINRHTNAQCTKPRARKCGFRTKFIMHTQDNAYV
jgi:hypothetical protein